MNEAAWNDAYPQTAVLEFRWRRACFSPDGKLFALVIADSDREQVWEQVWLCDLTARRLMPVTPKPPLASGPDASIIGWIADSLYAKTFYGLGAVGTYSGLRFFEATKEGVKTISMLPRGVEYVSNSKHGCDTDTETPCARNRSFVLTLNNAGHGDIRLVARTTNGREAYQVARGNSELESLIFEPNRSLVLFPRFFYAAIAVFDLNTRQIQETYLPNRAAQLLGAKSKADGFLVAYASYGPCQPDAHDAVRQFEPRLTPYNVCFANIPFGAKK